MSISYYRLTYIQTLCDTYTTMRAFVYLCCSEPNTEDFHGWQVAIRILSLATVLLKLSLPRKQHCPIRKWSFSWYTHVVHGHLCNRTRIANSVNASDHPAIHASVLREVTHLSPIPTLWSGRYKTEYGMRSFDPQHMRFCLGAKVRKVMLQHSDGC